MQQTRKSRIDVRTLTQFSLLLAIEIILGVTPLGLIMIPPIAITIMHIPVIIGAIVMGPAYGSLLGLSFGVISLIKAITSAVSPGDLLFNPAASGNPLASIVMCLVPRILLGLFASLLYMGLSRLIKQKVVCVGISAVAATVLHTVMVLGCLYLFFRAIPLSTVFGTIMSLNGVLEILAALLVAVPVCIPLINYNKSRK